MSEPVLPPPLPAPRPSRAWLWILLAAVAVLASILLLAGWGLGLVADQVADDLADNPVIREHLGTLEDVSIDWWGTGAASGENDFVFLLEGSKGKGTLHATVITIDAETERVTRGRLELPSGASYEILQAERQGP